MKTRKMKTRKMKTRKMLILSLFLISSVGVFAQNPPDLTPINSWLGSFGTQIRTIIKTIIGIAAAIGAVIVYNKMQNDEGGSGRKALLAYIGGLIFAALVWILIDTILA